MSVSGGVAVGPHDHLVTFSGTTGSLWLRVLLIGGALVVAAFVLLWPFLEQQSQRTVVIVTWIAAGTGLLDFLLAKGVDVPEQIALVLLVALAVPVTVSRAREPWLVSAATRIARLAPWVVGTAAAAAATEFGRAWLGDRGQDGVAVLLHTGLAIALVGLSWSTICRPRSPRTLTAVRIVAWGLASTLVAAAGHATILSTAG
ncbi:hypothetical protein SAMN05216266_10724 [Amycolatopsis marina]|uniref:Uncharacterized protein n=1 Tax=Amycolatopsis marina TaxID=490629 RepID=A0A1I0ZLY0_9PSEU|nr:DUF6239 family natural product biosynthesis protein [Amycolatopsis marina]SFB25398.1 hypothetical protein SAMN05216266_10724 [Amycolatopsis marina]